MNSAQRSSRFKEFKRKVMQVSKVEKGLGAVAARFHLTSLIDLIDFPLKKFGEPK
jgi:hypothetical protein